MREMEHGGAPASDSGAVIAPKKLIEVALPLDAINAACRREKSIRYGHPSTLHLWWARRPLAAARAVVFAQMVNDPSWKWEEEHPGEIPPNHLKASWAAKRRQLFGIIQELVLWENTTNREVFARAYAEIEKSWRDVCEANKAHPRAAELFDPEKIPAFHDPFAGGGAIPLEAQRLGLEAFASDLNPVAVLINKALIEIPPRFSGDLPVNPAARGQGGQQSIGSRDWTGAKGLAEDVAYYGGWIRDQAKERIGHLYPEVEVTTEMAAARPDLEDLAGERLTVVAWIWARTVKSPNPAFSHVEVPLASSFVLCPMAGKEAWVEPVVERDSYSFNMRVGPYPEHAILGTKATKRGANFRCVISQAAIESSYIKAEGQAGRLGHKLMAIVAEGTGGRVYLSPSDAAENTAKSALPNWKPEVEFLQNALGFRIGNYGLTRWCDLFTGRQLLALTTFAELVGEAREQCRVDALAAGMADDEIALADGGSGARAYGEALSVYLSFLVSKLADKGSSGCTWDAGPKSNRTASGRSARAATVRVTFGRQALPMTWDFAEVNFFSDSVGSIGTVLKSLTSPLQTLPASSPGRAVQASAQLQAVSNNKNVSTDPPYYDNIGYADLSDFFYVWLRRSLRSVFPNLLATVAVPKAEELVATPARHGGKQAAEAFFFEGMTEALTRVVTQAHPAGPVTIYYAFKQSETKRSAGTSSTGWEMFLEALVHAGLQITGTWPMRTELGNRMRSTGSNALASSVVLVCRPRSRAAPAISRRRFIRELNRVLPGALAEMTQGVDGEVLPVAPVDLSQAVIGPGMAVFSKYSAVLEADGSPMPVRTALQLINRFLAEDDFEADTQFCLHWFEQHGWAVGEFGEADVLARAKGTSVEGVCSAGVLFASGGKVHIRKWADYPEDWNPERDLRMPVWEVLHQLIRVLRNDGEGHAGRVLAKVAGRAEAARQLAYRLYTLCERKGWAEDARAYNELITSWGAIESAAAKAAPAQRELFED